MNEKFINKLVTGCLFRSSDLKFIQYNCFNSLLLNNNFIISGYTQFKRCTNIIRVLPYQYFSTTSFHGKNIVPFDSLQRVICAEHGCPYVLGGKLIINSKVGEIVFDKGKSVFMLPPLEDLEDLKPIIKDSSEKGEISYSIYIEDWEMKMIMKIIMKIIMKMKVKIKILLDLCQELLIT